MGLKRYEVKLSAQRAAEAVLLAEQDVEKRDELLKKCFGSRLEAVRAVDSEPMLVLATELLDRGEMVAGEQRWVFGWYKIWVTTSQWLTDIAPKLRGGSTDKGHIDPWMWEPAAGSLVWVGLASTVRGLDDPAGTPSAVIYVKPTYEAVREAVRIASAQGTMRREFPLSLRMFMEADPDTMQVRKHVNPEDWGLDLVRFGGVKTAKVREAMLLNDRREGGGEMELHFDSIAAMLADKDVRAEIAAQAERLAAEPERVKRIALSCPVEVLQGREDLKPYFGRQTREEVIGSLKPEEMKVVLTGKPELLKVAMALSEERAKKMKEYREGGAKAILLAKKLPDEIVERTLVNHEFEPGDDAAVERVAILLAGSFMGGGGGSSQVAGGGEAPKVELTDGILKERKAELDLRRARV